MKEPRYSDKYPLKTGKKLLLILCFSAGAVLSGVSLAFCFRYADMLMYYHPAGSDLVLKELSVLAASAVCLAVTLCSLFILLKDYKYGVLKKTKRWYIDKMLTTLVPVLIMTAITFLSFGEDAHGRMTFFTAGFIMLPLTGALVTPNVVGYALKDMKGWKTRMFRKNGNLHKFADDDDFYHVKSPVSFERRLYLAVFRDELLNMGTVIFVAIGVMVIAFFAIATDGAGGHSGDIIGAIFHAKAERMVGVFGIALLMLITFGIPVMAYYITNMIYKLRVVRRHDYIAYHAVVAGVDNYKLRINHHSGRWYKYDYCSCVGIRPKDVHNERATLIFVPDDLLLFPDKKQ